MQKIILAAVLGLMLPGIARAENDRMNLVVGFAAGGTSSVAARFVAEAVENLTGVSVLVENRPGAGGVLAAEWVRQQKDSKTLFFMSSTSALKIAPDSGLVPVGVIASYDYVAVAKKDAPRALAEYMRAAERDEVLRNVATAGSGSIPHLAGTKLFSDHGITMTHVPFRGSAPAMQSVLGGHVAMTIVPFPDFIGFKDELNVVARTGDGIAVAGWMGIFAPPGTSRGEIQRLAEIFQRASTSAKEKLESFGFRPEWRSDSELQAIHENDVRTWMPVAATLGVKP